MEKVTTLFLSSVSATQGSWRLLLCTRLLCRSPLSLLLAHTMCLHTHSHSFALLFTHKNPWRFCPMCIYTYTLYGIFTNVASAIYHHYVKVLKSVLLFIWDITPLLRVIKYFLLTLKVSFWFFSLHLFLHFHLTLNAIWRVFTYYHVFFLVYEH